MSEDLLNAIEMSCEEGLECEGESETLRAIIEMCRKDRRAEPKPSAPGEMARKAAEEILRHVTEISHVIADDPVGEVAATIQYALDRYAGQASAGQWVRVEERLPEDGEPVIFWSDYLRTAVGGWKDVSRWVSKVSGSRHKAETVTHWRRPLPAPPLD